MHGREVRRFRKAWTAQTYPRWPHEFLAADDAEAIKISEGWREGRRIELWQRSRIVKRWDSSSS